MNAMCKEVRACVCLSVCVALSVSLCVSLCLCLNNSEGIQVNQVRDAILLNSLKDHNCCQRRGPQQGIGRYEDLKR